MKSVLLFFVFLTACSTDDQEQRAENIILEDQYEDDKQENVKREEYYKYISVKTIEGEEAFSVSDLINLVEGRYEYDPLHRSLKMEFSDQKIKLIYGIPVVEHNGLYLPTDKVSLIVKNDEAYLPISFLEIVLGLDVEQKDDNIVFEWKEEALPASGNVNILDQSWNVEKMVDYLAFLNKPIENAQISTISNHLPGAKRAYRNGFHEGIDWYGYASGQHISTETPILAMAEGVVVRADHGFEEYASPVIRNKDLALTAQLGETPEFIFDRLRGRQVWVQYEKGVMNRFAHLDAIPETIQVGDKVSSDTIIGFVGNSGTSGAVNQDGSELHLHQDLLIYGELFWQPFSLEEVKEILISVFGE